MYLQGEGSLTHPAPPAAAPQSSLASARTRLRPGAFPPVLQPSHVPNHLLLLPSGGCAVLLHLPPPLRPPRVREADEPPRDPPPGAQRRPVAERGPLRHDKASLHFYASVASQTRPPTAPQTPARPAPLSQDGTRIVLRGIGAESHLRPGERLTLIAKRSGRPEEPDMLTYRLVRAAVSRSLRWWNTNATPLLHCCLRRCAASSSEVRVDKMPCGGRRDRTQAEA